MHLKLLQLELARTTEAEPEVMQHLEVCEECREELNRLKRLGELSADLVQPVLDIPEHVHESIHQHALNAVQRTVDRRRFIQWRRVASVAAILALCGLGIWISQRTGPAPNVAADIDGDGRVDIVDAFVLAKNLQTKSPLKPQWDLNSDGRIDQSDVDLIAQRAVAVKGGET
jgi:predicted anti-sigma-YlaC factor YlaD